MLHYWWDSSSSIYIIFQQAVSTDDTKTAQLFNLCICLTKLHCVWNVRLESWSRRNISPNPFLAGLALDLICDSADLPAGSGILPPLHLQP